ncbi:hypothetical protein L3X38_001982 [Prunus dulcis]|uniref:Uncharacterized protein n=1 Tax=Prunus dulcis TaxID=3755 RepID=A0AAD4WT51_PRUDU|nr:hypothetical protein L3X38_001982 [Prunus dulcis]
MWRRLKSTPDLSEMVARITQNGGEKPKQSRPNPSSQRLPEQRSWLGFHPVMIASPSQSHPDRSQSQVSLPHSGQVYVRPKREG